VTLDHSYARKVSEADNSNVSVPQENTSVSESAFGMLPHSGCRVT